MILGSYGQYYANTFKTLDEVDKFLEKHKFYLVTPEEIENVNMRQN